MIIFEHTVPALLIWGGLFASLAVVLYTFWRFVPRNALTLVIVAARVLFLALLTWCLFLPGLRRVSTELQKPRFIVAADTSRSMLLSPSVEVPNRWSVASRVLDRPWTRSVGADCEIDVAAFAVDVTRGLSLDELRAIPPNGEATLLRDCLRKLVASYAGLNVSGCLLLSDGIDTREAYDDWASEPRPFPIYTVLLEPGMAWDVEPDVRIDTINTSRRVTAGWKTELKAVLSGQGTGGKPVMVQLFRDDKLQREEPTIIPAGGGAKEVRFELDHPDVGVFTYRVFAQPMIGETHTNDNEYAVSVRVITSRDHLLYVEGTPRWESKYLTRALRANKQMTPLIFLRSPDGGFMTFGTRGDMTADMRESQLAFFKIVILGDLDAEALGEERAQNLVNFVDTGGSLFLLGGAQGWGPNGFAKTPLRKLLPVKDHGTAPVEGDFPVSLTDSGRAHAAFGGDTGLWEGMPSLLSVFPGVVLSAGARSLVVASTPQGQQPVLVTANYGQGKVAAVFTDSLWKWQLSPDAAEQHTYRRFWDQMVAWLAPEEEALDGRALELFADREQLFLGEEIELSARRTKEDAEPSALDVQCRMTEPGDRVLPFNMDQRIVVTPSGHSMPGYVFSYKAERPGLHTAMAVAEIDGREVESDPISFFVKPFTPESVPRPANVEVLRAIADNSGGAYFESIDALDDALASLRVSSVEKEISEYKSLWQLILIIVCLTVLLSAEWTLRKMRNMP